MHHFRASVDDLFDQRLVQADTVHSISAYLSIPISIENKYIDKYDSCFQTLGDVNCCVGDNGDPSP
jgi:hypothetical protein